MLDSLPLEMISKSHLILLSTAISSFDLSPQNLYILILPSINHGLGATATRDIFLPTPAIIFRFWGFHIEQGGTLKIKRGSPWGTQIRGCVKLPLSDLPGAKGYIEDAYWSHTTKYSGHLGVTLKSGPQ